MKFMFVTLDVSKLSGWLNADVDCRVERRACDAGARCAPRGGRSWGGAGASGMHGEGPTQGLGGRARAERTLNMDCMFVTLEVSKLSGWLNADVDCRVERRACDAGARCAPRGGRSWGPAPAQAACTGKAPLRAWGSGHARSAQ